MFKFGNQKPTIFKYAVVGVALSAIIATLSQCTGVSQNGLWDLLDEIQRKYFPPNYINPFILEDPEKLKRRIQRDVGKAIDKVTPEYNRIIREADQKYKPRYFEKPIDASVCHTEECKALGGEMRICAPWVENCVSGIYK